MKFPNTRGGFSGQGNKDARQLDNIDVAFLKRRRPGTVATKKGERLYVSKATSEDDGFYSLGDVGGAYKIVGSATARGTFTKRGDTTIPAGSLTYTSSLAFYGLGYGMVQNTVRSGYVRDFNGNTCNQYTTIIYLTSNGRDVKEHFRFVHDGLYNSVYGWGNVAVSVYDDHGEPRASGGVYYMKFDESGQPMARFLVDSRGSQTQGATVNCIPGQMEAPPQVVSLGPGTKLMMHRYVLPAKPSSPFYALCPGLAFSYTTDAGQTWTVTDADDMFAEFFSSSDAMKATGTATLFNDAVFYADVRAFMLTGNRAVVMCVVPCISSDGTQFVAKVKLGVCDIAAGCKLLAKQVLYEGPAYNAQIYMNAGGIGLPGGVLWVVRPEADEAWQKPRRLLYTEDGASVKTIGDMPFANNATGLITAISPATLICPMYDGNHSLYQSKDKGLTWVKRATLYQGAVAPKPEDQDLALQRFVQVTFLRDAGRPASLTPATPWASDSRFKAPSDQGTP